MRPPASPTTTTNVNRRRRGPRKASMNSRCGRRSRDNEHIVSRYVLPLHPVGLSSPGGVGHDAGAVTTTVYTDGACQGNPGPGGWAWAVPDGPYRSGAEPHTTNQRMEISAALQAVTGLTGPLVVVTDSTYVANCFRDRWWESWVANGWKNKAKKPVANRDLWEPLVDAVRAEPRRVQWRWVKGHGSDPMNDLVDRLAVAAARDQVGQAG